jgi:hypothetical protein
LQVPGAAEASVRNLPPSALGDASNFDAMGLLAKNKGVPMEALVEQVRDGSTLRIYLLPEFQFVQVFVAGIQVCFINAMLFWLLPFHSMCATYCFLFMPGPTNGKESCT